MLLNNMNNNETMMVSRSTFAVRAADMLRELILVDKLEPNEVLGERELSEKWESLVPLYAKH